MTLVKLLYKPLGLIISVVAGIAAAAVFKQVWRLLPGQEGDAPDSKDPDHGWKEIAVAATLQGAVFGGVKALMSRAGARSYQKATGVWPG